MPSINNHTTSREFAKKSLEMNQNAEGLFSRVILSKEMDQEEIRQNRRSSCKLVAAEEVEQSSFRSVYYAGAAGNVPFRWESRPGTPKHTSNDSSIPPLTPPPSYSYSKSKGQASPAHQKGNTNNFKLSSSSATSIFSIINLSKLSRKINNDSCVTPTSTSNTTPMSSSASMNSSSSSASSGTPKIRPRRRSDQLFADMDDDEEAERDGFPNSPLCFGGATSSRRTKGYCSVKNALSSIVGGHRSRPTVIYMA